MAAYSFSITLPISLRHIISFSHASHNMVLEGLFLVAEYYTPVGEMQRSSWISVDASATSGANSDGRACTSTTAPGMRDWRAV
jgi:hypothetical protein